MVAHFMPLACFCTPYKDQTTCVFLMLSGGIERGRDMKLVEQIFRYNKFLEIVALYAYDQLYFFFLKSVICLCC